MKVGDLESGRGVLRVWLITKVGRGTTMAHNCVFARKEGTRVGGSHVEEIMEDGVESSGLTRPIGKVLSNTMVIYGNGYFIYLGLCFVIHKHRRVVAIGLVDD